MIFERESEREPLEDVVIDASCLLNLLATRREVQIVEVLDWHLRVPEAALMQVRFLRTEPGPDGLREPVPVDLGPLRSTGRLASRGLDDEWRDAFVQCAEQLDDADASCVALAATLRAPLVADDRKVRRVAGEVGGISLVSTLDVVFDAADRLGLDQAALIQLAVDLRWRGNFSPPSTDPKAPRFAGLLAASR